MTIERILAARELWRADRERARYSRAEYEWLLVDAVRGGVSTAELARALGVSDEAVSKIVRRWPKESMRTAEEERTGR